MIGILTITFFLLIPIHNTIMGWPEMAEAKED